MKIKVAAKPYREVIKLKKPPHKKPRKPSIILAFVIRVLGFFELLKVKFTYEKIGMERLEKKNPL